MPAVVGTKSGPKAKEQSRGWKEGGTFFASPFLFPTGLKVWGRGRVFNQWNQ